MGRSSNPIRLTEGQSKAAGEILARAFHDYPQYDYLFTNVDEKIRKLPEVNEFLVRYGIMYGEVYATSPNLEGVAVWLPYWDTEITRKKASKCGGRELEISLGVEWYERYEVIEKCEYACHKQYADYPHWYLYPIGVDPKYQGKGHASLLLRAKLADIDEQNIPCYLETNKEINVHIYQHFGFKIVEEGIIPETDIPYWSMLRKKD